MSKKQATKVVNEYEADVKTAAQMMHNLIDTIYPKSDELKYARERMAENLVWRADRDAEYQATKVEEAKAKLDDAIYVERAIQEKQEREAINEPNTTVYDTRRERTDHRHRIAVRRDLNDGVVEQKSQENAHHDRELLKRSKTAALIRG